MATLQDLAPTFVVEIEQALLEEDRLGLAKAIRSIPIARSSYDRTVKMGYIHFARPTDPGYSGHLAAPVAETIAFAEPYWFNIEVDHDGTPFGIEVSGRPDLIAALRNGLDGH